MSKEPIDLELEQPHQLTKTITTECMSTKTTIVTTMGTMAMTLHHSRHHHARLEIITHREEEVFLDQS